MSTFQQIGLSILTLLIAIDLWALIRGHTSRALGLAWLLVCSSGVVALYVPDTTTRIARVLGIQRGADLLLYSSVMAGVIFVFFAYIRQKRVDRAITLIVREIAKRDACPPFDFDSPAFNPSESRRSPHEPEMPS